MDFKTLYNGLDSLPLQMTGTQMWIKCGLLAVDQLIVVFSTPLYMLPFSRAVIIEIFPEHHRSGQIVLRSIYQHRLVQLVVTLNVVLNIIVTILFFSSYLCFDFSRFFVPTNYFFWVKDSQNMIVLKSQFKDQSYTRIKTKCSLCCLF